MALNLDAQAQAARDLAKRCVPEGRVMGMGVLLRALFHGSDLEDRLPMLRDYLPEPKEAREETPEAVPLAASLKPILTSLAERSDQVLTPASWFAALLSSDAGREQLTSAGAPRDVVEEALAVLAKGTPAAEAGVGTVGDGGGGDSDSGTDSSSGAPSPAQEGWRSSKERKEVVEALASFGRMLTMGEPPQRGMANADRTVKAVCHALVQRKQHSALVIGPPGTGKSALVYEFSRLLMGGGSVIPERLRDHDVFELSPIFLRSGASYVGQYEERVSGLLKVLKAHPKVILFVDEAHSMFQSGMDHRNPFTDANEAFKQAIMNGEITVIGCTTTAEYRHYIKPDTALDERFTKVTIEEPSPEETKAIMHARRPRMEAFYGVSIPEELVDRTVALSEQYLLGRAQPRKSIQLLDGACAYCLVEDPPLEELTEAQIWEALEDTIGHSVVRERVLDPDEILDRLKEKITGQDQALSGIARAFATGVKGLVQSAQKPRGVFLFTGPTGVGKTETAVLLSRILGGGKEALLRVDCNTLKGSGHDGGPAQNVLFGPPPGYIGYVKGQGGVLSHIRDHPECVVLFDEIEKADPNVGELLFRIIDDGQCEDKEGNPLDFRRAFIIFTTNAGAVYEKETSIGFGGDPGLGSGEPATDQASMRAHFVGMGLGEAFLGRITHVFDFKGLDGGAGREILGSMLESFAETVAEKGHGLTWGEPVLDRLLERWPSHLGARSLAGVLQNQVVEPWVTAHLKGELDGVETIRLEVTPGDEAGGEEEKQKVAGRAREGDTLVIYLA